MRSKLSWGLLALVFLCGIPAHSAEKSFRLHLSREPANLDPQKANSVASYVLANLYRNLFTYDNDRGLVPELAESCLRPSDLILECKLKKDLKWSDGQTITSADFLRSYQKLLDSKNQSPRADLLFKIKDALSYYQGKAKTFGITTPDALSLRFEFSEPDLDFEYDLANLQLSPSRENLKAYSGPYKLKEWKKGQKILIEKNENYFRGDENRPPVEFLFIEEDTVALQLYEKNELQFLRRLPTLFISSYKSKPDFHSVPVIRFDYIGFGKPLNENRDVREALSLSLQYPELQKIFSSPGIPGCSGLPESWEEKVPCHNYDFKSAQRAWAKVPADLKEKSYPLLYSTLGGEDHQRATEWMQSQWKKIGAKVQPTVMDNKIYLSEMKKEPAAIFRKGIAVERPTCLAALSVFTGHHPENYLRLREPAYDQILKKLSQSKTPAEKKKYCTLGVEFLMKDYRLIPTGRYELSLLAKPDFAGWKLNQMNQLDLSDLHLLKSVSK